MSVITAPFLNRLSDASFAASFAYDFTGDSPVGVSYGGANTIGSQYTFSAQNLNKSVALIPRWQTLQISATFQGYNELNNVDGDLIVYVPLTGSVFKLAPTPIINPTGDPAYNGNGVVTSVLPIIVPSNSPIVFIKNYDGTSVWGKIFVTLFTDSLSPVFMSGAAYDPVS